MDRLEAVSAQVDVCPDANENDCGANSPRKNGEMVIKSNGDRLWPPFKSTYRWQDVHKDLNDANYAGCYGWDNGAYWAIAERKAGVDLREWYKRRTEAEYYLPDVKELIDDPVTQANWDDIFMFDPLGMYANPPTIAACKANLDIAELHHLPRDGKIIREEDGQIRTQKIAINYAWNLPRIAERLNLPEAELREALFKFSKNPDVKDPTKRVYIPAVGGCTVYVFGDVRKIRDPHTEICVRVHDECIGSDVFGSDICTCRPYLIFALEQCILCAQRGGVGIVVYYRKEGRSLGEVIKFRVYNARENQVGGDNASAYFNHTETIAGIRDARFQVMMPDALRWLGIKRIDWLCSMSNEKYEAIVGSGIKVMQRVTLPEDYVKENMKVEITAKVASGYNSETLDITAINLQTMAPNHVRDQCQRVLQLGKIGKLSHFSLDLSQLPKVTEFVEQVIRETYPDATKIPPHSRIRHVENLGGYKRFMEHKTCSPVEHLKRQIDLLFVSVLLDAGSDPNWVYSADGKVWTRSEGLAHAALDMFLDGQFSSDKALPTRVNSLALKELSEAALQKGFQVSPDNQMPSLKGRLMLLRRLGEALEQKPDFFGIELPRPGNIVDKCLCAKTNKVSLRSLWDAVIQGLDPMWPKHATGLQTGDIWRYAPLGKPGLPGSDLVSFHKLPQWLLYSLVEAFENAGFEVLHEFELTPLAEYRNGGLLVDLGVLKCKDPADYLALHSVGSELIVEWRALTVCLIDMVADELKKKLGLSLAQVLEGGTWRAGRVIAQKLRPDDRSPPIKIRSDGTVF